MLPKFFELELRQPRVDETLFKNRSLLPAAGIIATNLRELTLSNCELFIFPTSSVLHNKILLFLSMMKRRVTIKIINGVNSDSVIQFAGK